MDLAAELIIEEQLQEIAAAGNLYNQFIAIY